MRRAHCTSVSINCMPNGARPSSPCDTPCGCARAGAVIDRCEERLAAYRHCIHELDEELFEVRE
jgi:hypothetical protein